MYWGKERRREGFKEEKEEGKGRAGGLKHRKRREK